MSKQQIGLYVQMHGRAWRPGNKPRICWIASKRHWQYNMASVARISKVCSIREIQMYSRILNTLNRSNGHAF